MKKTVFIINPAAGKGKGVKTNAQIREYLKKNSIDAEIILTERTKHAAIIAEQLGADYKRVISVGGDGTLNEVINGLSLSIEREVGILPIGSGNDFASALKMGKNIASDLTILLSDAPTTQKVDIGQIKYSEHGDGDEIYKTRFINSLGYGFDAYVAYLNQTNQKLSGIASYIYAVLRALSRFNASEIEFIIDKKQKVSGKKLMLAVGNSKTTGGGFYLTPDAEINDGKFNLCTLDDVSNFKLLQALPKALFNKIKSVQEVSLDVFTTLNITVENEGYFVHCDGENITKNICSAEIKIIEHELKFITG